MSNPTPAMTLAKTSIVKTLATSSSRSKELVSRKVKHHCATSQTRTPAIRPPQTRPRLHSVARSAGTSSARHLRENHTLPARNRSKGSPQRSRQEPFDARPQEAEGPAIGQAASVLACGTCGVYEALHQQSVFDAGLDLNA